ncbi:hypothetical protein PVAND_009793 [Polypedilum vanderplanki]|uniref:Uncharacterized protein n=1 Tax=Polypedilum vanderplanki TaxID=319348 RepID=A0A9J6CER8_POLVA|nr:hypothetical protein PVAND_009793 [Polypedilum vanderplanki]
MKLRILCILIIAIIGVQAFPQRQRQRNSESPDFNYDGKLGGEKAHRSLDQVQYQDGGIRGRSSFTDSYGNPVAYDSLDDVDAQKPSNNKDNPFQYVIPGYASGILQPHEIPSRNADDEGRKIDDDRVHFVDPLNPNSFQTFDKVPTPSISLAAPGQSNPVQEDSQSPIDIPKPNIDLSETPEAPIIDDPIDHVPPHPPQDVFLNPNANLPPSTTLELPVHQDSSTNPIAQNLIPPGIPATEGVDIPRPNLDASETPIDDNSNSPLNQGLLPPSNIDSNDPSSTSFNNPINNGPVIITDDQIKFAPKPVNGLLPPKEPIGSNDIFQSAPNSGSSDGVPQFTGTLTNDVDSTTKKQFTPFPTQPSFQIPVQVIQSPPSRPNFIQPPKTSSIEKGNKYQGGFGGSPGVLSSTNLNDRVVPTASLPLAPSTSDKFFGGASGVLSNDNNNFGALPAASTTSQTFTQAAASSKTESLEKARNKYTGNFGGPAGILTPNA